MEEINKMKEETVSFKRKLGAIGGSIGITIPKELSEFLSIKEGSEVRLAGFNGKYGKYIAMWVDEGDNDGTKQN